MGCRELRGEAYSLLNLLARVRISFRLAVDIFSKYFASFRIDFDWLVWGGTRAANGWPPP